MSKTTHLRPVLRFLRIFVSRIFADDLMRTAAALAYYLLFAAFALLLTGSTVLSRCSFDPGWLLQRLSPVVPDEILALVADYLASASGGAGLLSAVMLTLYSVTRVINTLLAAFSRIYRVKKPRRNLHRLGISAVLAALILISLPLMPALILLSERIVRRLFPGIGAAWDLLRFALLGLWALILLTALYTLAPNRPIRPRSALPGAAFAGLGWLVVSMGFSIYVNRLARYSILYGSLSTMIVLMLWLYLTGIILLLGGLFNHLLEAFQYRSD